ncbi:MAG: calcium-translocating P-type ATPase, PMCA-type [Bacteroidaceae bacterium]|nr:calcium-translocating P-type ATPase, PMCA-type [Bacteroidaceae bacterium]
MEENKKHTGLTQEEVLASRRQHGENVLTPPAKTPLWKQFLEKFQDPIIRILLLAFLASVGIACFEFFHEGESQGDASAFFEPIGIFVAIILATGIGFWFEVKANRAFDILNQVNDDDPVQAIRDGRVTEVPKRDIVVGDIVVLGTGVEVPADGELLESVSLQINESTLTGEPIVKKSCNPADYDSEATYPTNQAMRGTTVVDGHGIMRVIAVGDATENGKVFTAAQIDNSERTPLNIQLDGLGNVITKISYGLAALILVGRIVLFLAGSNDFTWDAFIPHLLQTIMIAVTLIVVSVPEGLPMSVTLSLALSMRRMLKTNNLVRKMHACETMGATTVICTDKTGTLTQNQMRIHETRFFGLDTQQLTEGDEMSALLAEAIAVNSTAFLAAQPDGSHKVMGNPTEGALLLWLTDQGRDYEKLRAAAPVLEQLTFSTERKYMATVVRSAALPGKRVLFIKGAPEIVHGLCRETLGGITRATIDEQLQAYQNKAMRTLGFGYQVLNDGDATIADGKAVAERLTFLGIVAIADPVRREVPDAVQSCIDAGINIKIVTGDTPGTAREIGRQIGLWQPEDGDRNQITGPEFAALSDSELEERILDLKIISRARPMDKKRLVETLQKKGQVVAVTGDGTNDAPALKAAHVGLSMGDGTSVAKEASDITIMDNSFTSITRAVMWGRSLYRNIQRFILFQMTINVTACLIVLIGAFVGTKSPLTVTQMLWVNLIMDTFAAMALASLPPSMDVMNHKPRRREDFIVSRDMWTGIVGMGITFTVVLTAVMLLFNHCSFADAAGREALLNFHMTDGAEPFTLYKGAVFFTLFVFLQFWNMFNAKSFLSGRSAFHNMKESKGFMGIALLIVFGQVAIVSLGGKMFSVAPLSFIDWVLLFAITSVVLILGELKRMLR